MEAKELFEKIAKGLAKTPNIEVGQMFGKQCVKVNGSAFAAFQNDCMVFKLEGSSHQKALLERDAKLWDPSGKGRPMKEWIQVPYSSSKQWQSLAGSALEYVSKK